MANAKITEQERSELRARAIARTESLVNQLESDRASVVDWNDRQKKANADTGIEAVTCVIEAARRVQSTLQGG